MDHVMGHGSWIIVVGCPPMDHGSWIWIIVAGSEPRHGPWILDLDHSSRVLAVLDKGY